MYNTDFDPSLHLTEWYRSSEEVKISTSKSNQKTYYHAVDSFHENRSYLSLRTLLQVRHRILPYLVLIFLTPLQRCRSLISSQAQCPEAGEFIGSYSLGSVSQV